VHNKNVTSFLKEDLLMGTREQDLVLYIDEILLFFFLGCCFMMQALKFVSFAVQTLCNVWRNDTSHGEVNPFFLGTKELSVSLCVLSLSSNLCSMVSLLRFDRFTRRFQNKLFKGYNMGICNPVIYATLGSYGVSLTGLFIPMSVPVHLFCFPFSQGHQS
jgi:hypothetical protein